MHVGNPTDSASVQLIGAEYKGGGGTRERPMRNRAVIADQIDYWIRRHSIRASCGTHPAQNKSKLNPARDRLVGLSAIGQCLKDHYDALTPPIPPHLAALVEQLKTEK